MPGMTNLPVRSTMDAPAESFMRAAGPIARILLSSIRTVVSANAGRPVPSMSVTFVARHLGVRRPSCKARHQRLQVKMQRRVHCHLVKAVRSILMDHQLITEQSCAYLCMSNFAVLLGRHEVATCELR